MLIANTSPYIKANTISTSNAADALYGMYMDNSYSAALNSNNIEGYHTGFYLYYSSPTMLLNSAISDNDIGPPECSALNAQYYSSPLLKGTADGPATIVSASWNNLLNTSGTGIGIVMKTHSVPNIDEGRNDITGGALYIYGELDDDMVYYARNNCWVEEPPNPLKFNLNDGQSPVVYLPYNCGDMPGGGSKLPEEEEDAEPAETAPDPQPIIVDYGHGFKDTLEVRNQIMTLTPAQIVFFNGIREGLLSNFTSAVSHFQDVVQNYTGIEPRALAVESMRRIMYCKDRMHADSSAYATLRSYYQNIIQSNPSDTFLVKAARELAAKTLVRMHRYQDAITEYEDIISSSSDSAEILCCELNIIETYMLIPTGGGNSPQFTGRLAYLRPASRTDALRMIHERIGHVKSGTATVEVPGTFQLSQNYPNPFNAFTKINYSLPKASKVTIKLYDILGRLVKELVNDFKDVGYHSLTFDGTNLSSGVYFYKLEAGTFVDSKKMVIVK
jgi:hypothetical protein